MPLILHCSSFAKENTTQYNRSIAHLVRFSSPTFASLFAAETANFTLHIRLDFLYTFIFEIRNQLHQSKQLSHVAHRAPL